MKGIILSGGRGTRMFPVTKAISKQLLPVYDKPMIYYPLSVLLLASIREILIISSPESLPLYKELLGDGSALGISIEYAAQESPRGIAHSILVAEDFLDGDSFCLCLGDNIFYGQDLTSKLTEAAALIEKGAKEAVIFGYMVKNPSEFGVIEFDAEGRVISIDEKPPVPKSNFIVPGLYFYSNSAVEFAKQLAPSARGELEITALNNIYIGRRSLHCMEFGRGFAWLDTGTPDRLLRASEFIETVQNNQGFYVSCIEEIAWRRGFITKEQMHSLGNDLLPSEYGKYLLSL